jgi:hypothetical protein
VTRPLFNPGDRVRVVAAIDQTVHDVAQHIGKTGTVRALDTEEPSIWLALDDGAEESFWREELEAA